MAPPKPVSRRYKLTPFWALPLLPPIAWWATRASEPLGQDRNVRGRLPPPHGHVVKAPKKSSALVEAWLFFT
jgi:hypothetical protein